MHKSHTHRSHTQVSHTQVSDTQVTHTQVSHTSLTHTSLTHTSLTHKSHMPILRAHVTAHLFRPSCITGIVHVSPFGGAQQAWEMADASREKEARAARTNVALRAEIQEVPKKKAFVLSLPKCRTPTFAICPEFISKRCSRTPSRSSRRRSRSSDQSSGSLTP